MRRNFTAGFRTPFGRALDERAIYLAALCLVLLVPCGRAQTASAADPPGRSSATAKTSGKEVTAEDAKKWAAELQRAVRVGDVDTFNSLIDWDGFIDRATAVPAQSPELKKFRQDFVQALKIATTSPKGGFGHLIMAGVEAAGEYRPLRIHREAGRERALFRLISSNGALNYHDYILERSPTGAVVATDCVIFLMGELYSQNVRRSFLSLAHHSVHGPIEGLTGADQDMVAHADEYAQMGSDAQQKKWKEALAIYKRLPLSLQDAEPVLTIRLFAEQVTGKSGPVAAIDEIRKQHPNDPMILLLAIDGYSVFKAFDKSYECIDQLDKLVGGDPYLKILRANVLEREKKFDEARDLVQSALADEPNLVRGYYAMIEISLARRDDAETLKWLRNAEAQGIKFGDLKTVAPFAEFVKSPQYKTWLKLHGKTE